MNKKNTLEKFKLIYKIFKAEKTIKELKYKKAPNYIIKKEEERYIKLKKNNYVFSKVFLEKIYNYLYEIETSNSIDLESKISCLHSNINIENLNLSCILGLTNCNLLCKRYKKQE